jgi:hypothetical protein
MSAATTGSLLVLETHNIRGLILTFAMKNANLGQSNAGFSSK